MDTELGVVSRKYQRCAIPYIFGVAVSVIGFFLSEPRAADAAKPCTAELREFVSSEAAYSGYARLELVREVRVVMRSNFNVHDAEQILTVAEDVARGERMPLDHVVRAILHVANGDDGSEVAAIDPRARVIIERRGRLSELLTLLARDFKNSVHDHDPRVALGRLAVRRESDDYVSEIAAACGMRARAR